MRVADRLRRLEAESVADDARRRQIEADAAAFMRQIDAMAARIETPDGTAEEFLDSIRASGDSRLISIFFGDDAHAHS